MYPDLLLLSIADLKSLPSLSLFKFLEVQGKFIRISFCETFHLKIIVIIFYWNKIFNKHQDSW